MALHDAIVRILTEAGTPLTIEEVSRRLNSNGLSITDYSKTIDTGLIQKHVKNYSKVFDYINGQVVLTTNSNWRRLITSYWYLTGILRNYFSQSDFQFILISLLFLKRLWDLNELDRLYYMDFYKKPLLSPLKDRNIKNFKEIIEGIEDIKEIDDSLHIIHDIAQLLKRLDREILPEVVNAISDFNTFEYSPEEFGPLFEYFLHNISEEFSNSTIPYTPKYLQKLMISLLAPEKEKRIYDPVCGSGGLLIEALAFARGNLYTKATEINLRMTQLGYMNLVMNGFFTFDYRANDFLRELYNGEKYDYIIGDLPINQLYNSSEYFELYRNWGISPPKSDKGFSSPVLFVLSKLSNQGKAVITVSESFLFRGGREKNIRNILIHEDIIESVISLPHGALRPYTTAKCSILILNLNKPVELQRKIKFIDSITTYSDSKSISINSDEIIELNQGIHSKPSSLFNLVEHQYLKPDLNLTVNTYSAEALMAEDMLYSKQAVKLGDIVKIKSGTSPQKEHLSSDGDFPIAKIENLSKDILDLNLDIKSLNYKCKFNPKYKRSLLSSKSILIARIGDYLKPTFFEPSIESETILFHSGLFALIPINKDIDPEYLYYQLHTEFVTDQIRHKRMGAVMPHISIAQLKEVIIPFMKISAQKEFVASQKASIVAAERAKVEEKIKAIGFVEEVVQKESNIVKTLVHQLRPILSSIDMQVKSVGRIIDKYQLNEKQEFEEKSIDIDPELEGIIDIPKNFTLGELIKKTQSDTLHLNNVLTTVNKVMNFKLDESDQEPTDIYQFIQDYSNQHQSKKNIFYSIELTGEHITLSINPPSFREMLDQLFLNAEKHGFSDREKFKGSPKISFKVKKSIKRQVAIIEYKNNGTPYKLTEEVYKQAFQKGQTSSGSGIGGNYINRIIKAHKGEIKIKENLKNGFHMIIEIPINRGNDYE